MSLFSAFSLIFSAGILYVGESAIIGRCLDLECLSSKLHIRFQIPFGR